MEHTAAFSILSVCPACSAKNRVPAAHLADTGRCGSCKSPLPAVAEPIDVDAAAFDEILQAAKVPVLVDFWAAWCGPCRMAAPEVHKLAQQVQGRALVLKVDTDACPQIAGRYRVQSIPNFIVFRNGQVRLQRAGVASSKEMLRWIEQA